MNKSEEIYWKAVDLGIDNQLNELQERVVNIRGDEIEGGIIGISMAFGAQWDRITGRDNQWNNKVTGSVAYEEAQRIDNLLANIENLRLQLNKEHYFGMMKALSLEMTRRHGRFGER